MSSRKRSVGQQVKSGFFIAGGLIGGFLTFMTAVIGIGGFVLPPSPIPRPLVGPVIGSVEIVLAATIMFATAGRWPKHAVGVIFGWGALRALIYIVFPTDKAPRGEAVGVAVYCILVSTLLYRFIRPHKSDPTISDRIALTALGLSCASVIPVSISFSSPGVVASVLGIGLLPLVVVWAIHHHQNRQRARERPVGADGPTLDAAE